MGKTKCANMTVHGVELALATESGRSRTGAINNA